MTDSIVHTARSFADYYGISRERLARIIAASFRERGGVFGLAGYGYFRAELVAPKRMEIRPFEVTRAAADSIPLYPLKGSLNLDSPATQPAAPRASRSSAPESASAAPSKYDLELQIMQERATALRQKNVLEQARLRDETVSYCSEAIQILLMNLRADIDSINLAPSEAARLREAIDAALADLAAVLPAIIAGQPAERIELELSARRADRISSSRHPLPDQSTEPPADLDSTSIDNPTADLDSISIDNPTADLDSASTDNPTASA